MNHKKEQIATVTEKNELHSDNNKYEPILSFVNIIILEIARENVTKESIPQRTLLLKKGYG